jgi:hypothetical protein
MRRGLQTSEPNDPELAAGMPNSKLAAHGTSFRQTYCSWGIGASTKRPFFSLHHLDRLGSMLAVSTSIGGGTAVHYDQGDAGKPFARLKRIVY